MPNGKEAWISQRVPGLKHSKELSMSGSGIEEEEDGAELENLMFSLKSLRRA